MSEKLHHPVCLAAQVAIAMTVIFLVATARQVHDKRQEADPIGYGMPIRTTATNSLGAPVPLTLTSSQISQPAADAPFQDWLQAGRQVIGKLLGD